MKWLIISIFAFALCADESHVLVLTDANFEETIKNNSIVMVKFFAPWCGHCKAFAPEYEKAAKEIKEANLPFIFADLDATVHKETATKFGIKGYPTIKLFYNGEPMDYKGERTSKAVISFIKKTTGPVTKELKTVNEVKEAKEAKGLRCILATTEKEKLDAYVEIAKNDNDYDFFYAPYEIVKQVFSNASEGDVIVLKDFDEVESIYSGDLKGEKLKEYLLTESIPPVTGMTENVIKQVFKPNGRTAVILIYSDKDKESKVYEEEYEKVAKELRSSEFIFIKVAKEDREGSYLAEYMGVQNNELPLLMISRVSHDTLKYLHKGKLDQAEIKAFIEDYRKDKVPRFYKSEPIPSENPGPVYKLVSNNFKQEVLDNDDDVMIKFYAPWCGHCKKLAPVYENVAKKLKSNKKLKMMEVDSTLNDIEGHPIRGFPVVKFFPGKNKQQPLEYNGARDEENIINFIKEKSSYEVVVSAFAKTYDEKDLEKDDL